MSLTMAPICVACKHFQGWDKADFGGKCAAYPSGIPRAILLNQVDHRHPHAGDHGITFTPKRKADADYPALVFSGKGGSSEPLSQTIPAPSASESSEEK